MIYLIKKKTKIWVNIFVTDTFTFNKVAAVWAGLIYNNDILFQRSQHMGKMS